MVIKMNNWIYDIQINPLDYKAIGVIGENGNDLPAKPLATGEGK